MSEVGCWVESGARVRSLIPEVHAWAVSPDDAWIAWTEHRRDHVVNVTEVSSRRTVATLHGAPTAALHWTSPSTLLTLRRAHRNATLHAHDAGNPTHLVWVSPSSVVAAFLDDRWGTVLYRLHEVGGRDLVTRFDRNDRIVPGPALDLHPDRGRVLITVERATDRERSNARNVALVVGLSTDGAAKTEMLGLGRDRGPSWRDRSGGACWDAQGRLLTLTHPHPRTALLARRDAVLVPPENLAEVPLDGASPHALSLRVSPRASLALASWRVSLNDVGDTAKRLAIVSLT